jgi:hypothetical protein
LGLLSNAAAAETKARVGIRLWCLREEAETETARASMVLMTTRRIEPRARRLETAKDMCKGWTASLSL